MRIAAFPKGYLPELLVHRTMTVLDWIEKARGLGVDGLELHPGFFHEGTEAELDATAESLADAGLAMPMMCASPDFTHPDPVVRAQEIADQERAIEITARLGGPGATCRVLSGQAHPEISVAEGLDLAATAIRQLLPVAQEHGVVLALENHYKASTWTYPELARKRDAFLALVQMIDDREWFGVQFDPSNALVAGDDPVELLRDVVDRVVTMQASDRYLANGATLAALRASDGTIGYSPDLRHGVIGEGLNDYPAIFGILVDAGYDGWISIEDGVDGFDQMVASADFLRHARDEWFKGSNAVRVPARAHDQENGQDV